MVLDARVAKRFAGLKRNCEAGWWAPGGAGVLADVWENDSRKDSPLKVATDGFFPGKCWTQAVMKEAGVFNRFGNMG